MADDWATADEGPSGPERPQEGEPAARWRGAGIARALADTRFTELVTPRLLRPVDLTVLVVAGIAALTAIVRQVQTGVDALRYGEAVEGIVRIVLGIGLPLACWFLVAAGVRILLEVVVVVLDLHRRTVGEDERR